MTLEEAVTEVKRVVDRGHPVWKSGGLTTDTILNAVASGDLIPRPHEYTLSAEAQRIVVAAREAPQWDTTRDRLTSPHGHLIPKADVEQDALADAIADVKRNSPRINARGDRLDEQFLGTPSAETIVMSAVINDALIPASDARLAVAMAYQRAADEVLEHKHFAKGIDCAAECILALADTDALAEVQALRAALQWYGEQARLCRLIHSEGDAGRQALNDDGGKRARAALGDAG